MFIKVLSFLKVHKKIASILGVASLLLTLYLSWNSFTDSIYQDGYDAAVQDYQVKLIEQQNKYQRETEEKIRKLRKQLSEQYAADLERIQSEQNIDTDVDTATKYIREKIYVEKECDSVPDDLNRMFNQSISSINGTPTN